MNELTGSIPAALWDSLPTSIRKILRAAEDNGWELNGKGLSLAIRLDHPTDEIAIPLYVTYSVGKTGTGKVSARFMSAATATLKKLGPRDVLAVLADPTLEHSEWEYEEDA